MNIVPPPEWTGQALLADGRQVSVRPIDPTDVPALAAFHAGQSEESTYLRFFAVRKVLSPSELQWLTGVDHRDRLAMVGELDGRIVGVARMDRARPPTEAEVAVAVADSLRRRGLGKALLVHLAQAARQVGVATFTAEVLSANVPVLTAFARAGTRMATRWEDGVVHARLTL